MVSIMWVLTIVSLIGNYLNCRKIRICFVVWIACNVGWILIDFYNAVYSRAVLDLVQIGFSVYGLNKWSKAKE